MFLNLNEEYLMKLGKDFFEFSLTFLCHCFRNNIFIDYWIISYAGSFSACSIFLLEIYIFYNKIKKKASGMKEFIKNRTVTYNLMSFTGFKSLIVFSLLLDGPKSYDEINQFFKKHEYIKEAVSIDTLRVYLTSLRKIGCEIIRTPKIEGAKYKLVSHPFELQITEEQLKSLIKVYKSISRNIDLKELIMLENFLRKIASIINDENLNAAIEKHSLFNNIDIKLIDSLVNCCDRKEQIVILYNSPRSGAKQIEIITDKVEMNNNKFYLYGTSIEYEQYSYFLVSRIISIVAVKAIKTKISDRKKVCVGYELKIYPNELKLTEDEKLIDIKDDGSLVIENSTSNPFIVKQRVLSLGYSCKVLYPESFKKDIIETLKKMREEYSDGQIK